MAKLNLVSKEQVIERIRFDNPWWSTQKIDPFFFRMKRRAYFDLFYPLVSNIEIKRAVILMGPRRIGKTVLIFHAIQNLIEAGVDPRKICYLSIETPVYTGLSLDMLFRYFQEISQGDAKEGAYVFYDEIQYLKGWEVHLKSMVDSYHSVKFVASGSAAAALKLKSNESGAGRFTDFLLPPLTFMEFLQLQGKEDVFNNGKVVFGGSSFYEAKDIESLNEEFVNYINYGGYPEVLFSNEIQADPGRFIRSDIIDKVLLRDLPSLYGIQDIQELNALFTSIAYNTGSEISLDSLANNSGVSKNTIKKYLTYLEAAFLIKIIHRVDFNAKRFKRAHNFKVYLTNPSLRTALFGLIGPTDKMWGNLVETAIYSQWLHSEYHELYYARDKSGEIDILRLNKIDQQPEWVVEIKYSDRYFENMGELNHIYEFCIHHGMERDPLVTTRTKTGIKAYRSKHFLFVPSSSYCYTVSKNLVENKKEELVK